MRIKQLIDRARAYTACDRGLSLLSMAFVVMVLGVLFAGGAKLYDIWTVYGSSAETGERMAHIQSALNRYFAENGRYPCPAALDAAIDSGRFGVEVSGDCTAGALAGTFRAAGRDGRMVRTGTVPVRTLGIADFHMFDGYNQRFVYAVTEAYAVEGTQVNESRGAIFIEDGNGNSATETPGNVVKLVYSMGWDRNGAYSLSGVVKEPCDPGARSGENCDFGDNAVFMNTLNTSTNENNLFVHQISYQPPRIGQSCEDKDVTVPGQTAFIIDTSGSMGYSGKGRDGFTVKCPASMPGCSRMDVARWAMRRVMPARIYNNNNLVEEPKETLMTGFKGYNNVYNVENNLRDVVFDDPTAPDYTPPQDDELNAKLESDLQDMCPQGSTPLGLHIKALADRLGDGNADRPNKITVLSDGVSNNGNGDGSNGRYDPVAAAKYIKNTYPNVQVDIIDVVGNPELAQAADLTGGSYYRSDNPDQLLDDLYHSAGICEPYSPSPPKDQAGCGSSGDWWE